MAFPPASVPHPQRPTPKTTKKNFNSLTYARTIRNNRPTEQQTQEEEEEPAAPYAAEVYRCEQLISHLKTTYMKEEKAAAADGPEELSGEFASMQLTTKKSNDDDYMSGSLTGGKKKGKGGSGGKKKGKKIILDVITMEWFGDLGMVPPNNEDKVKMNACKLNTHGIFPPPRCRTLNF